MLEKNFAKVYNKFKLLLYTRVLKDFAEDGGKALSAQEVICMEIIVSLNEPTVAQFANYAKISAPNAAYRVNKLINKGYVNKVQSERDKREYHLVPTEKYNENYGSVFNYIDTVSERIKKRFPEEESETLDKMLEIIAEELMPEVNELIDSKTGDGKIFD